MSYALFPLHLQLLAGAVLLAFLGWVVQLIRHHRLSLRDSLLWLVSTTAALAAVIFPITLQWVAGALGIAVPSNAVFAVAFVYVFLNLLATTITISKNAAHVRRLTQECAILRSEFELLRERIQRGAPESHEF